MEMTYSILQEAIRSCFDKERRINRNCKNPYAKQLSQNGIVIIEDFVSAEQCEKLYQRIINIIAVRSDSPSGKEYVDGVMLIDRGKRFNSDHNMVDIFDIEEVIPELSEIKNSSLIASIVQEASGEDLAPVNFNAYYNRGIRPRVLHVDTFTTKQYKAFVYLTNVNCLDDGPYLYVKGSHVCSSKKILCYLENYENDHYATDMRAYTYDEATPCIAKKGTLIITDQNGVHGAHPQPEDRERVLLMMNFSERKIVPK